MSAATATDIVPLSTFRPERSLREFLDGLLYPEEPGRWHRFAGDHVLLEELDQELKRAAGGGGSLGTVGDLADFSLREIVEHVEETRYGTWRLPGDPNVSLVDRLDEHFRPMQERHVEHVRLRDEERARRASESAQLSEQVEAAARDNASRLWGVEL